MNKYVTSFVQNESQLLRNEYRSLEKQYFELKNSTLKLYESLKEKEDNTCLEDLVNDIAINNDPLENTYFIQYTNDKKKLIEEKFSNVRMLDESKIQQLLGIKKSRLNRNLENLTPETIGTVMNLLSEFYDSVYRDFERNTNKVRDSKKENHYKNNINHFEFISSDGKKRKYSYIY